MHRFAVGLRDCPRQQRSPLVALLARALGLALLLVGAHALVAAQPVAAQPVTFLDRGLRWVGRPMFCSRTPDWRAELVFNRPGRGGDYCLYTWDHKGAPNRPDVDNLFLWAGTRLVEDVPVLEPMQAVPWTPEEVALYAGLRAELLAHVGTAELLPAMPAAPQVRVVVLDTAPDAGPFETRDGLSRHGDTLARLIEDLVCHPGSYGGTGTRRKCAAEVTTELAMPWIESGVAGPDGGRTGSLSDLARAIRRAVDRWASDPSAPPRLILNLSLGWEHTLEYADCFADPHAAVDIPAQLVQEALRDATSRGALVLAAAGNDPGGTPQREGLTCPGAYQGLLTATSSPRPLVLAVAGVDYADQPLESTRKLGRTSLLGLGLGGMAWVASGEAPPSMTGSSVATAVVSAVSALVWAHRPAWNPAQVTQAVHEGGELVLGAPAEACPVTFSCVPRRASTCGALNYAGANIACMPAPAKLTSTPPLPAEFAALIAALPSQPIQPMAPPVYDPDPLTIPRFIAPSDQVKPWTFPMPIQATCPTCYAGQSLSVNQVAHVSLRNLGKKLFLPMLVVRFAPGTPSQGTSAALALGAEFAENTTIAVELPQGWTLQSAYLTAFADSAHERSVTEQIFVHGE